ncbi:MAG: ATP-binding protein [Planctomycetes bacterium]|nr:ATP-binding protein [Planctomycetota bacterium]
MLLLGPRQTGKSTFMAGQLPPDAWRLDLLHADLFQKYSKDPSLFRLEVEERVRRGVSTVFVDEVQRIPALLDEIHGLIERTPVRFLLTGSSARKLKRGGANLLAGRAAVLPLHPLVVQEHGESFDLERALRIGALPAVVSSNDADARSLLADYANTYLREEIQAEALVRNLGGFARFLDVAAAQSGELLNASSVGRDAALPGRTVSEYFSILEDTLLGLRLEAWRKSVRARLVAHPRFYLFDTGVTNALNRRLTAEVDPITRGRLFEQWLVLECRRLLDYARSEARLFFWRTNTGAEVDLLVEKHGKLRGAIEIKTARRIGTSDLSGLRSFSAENPGVPTFLVTPSAEPHRLGDSLVTNWRDFLAQFREWL